MTSHENIIPTLHHIPQTHTAFFYGTLMSPAVLQRVCHGPDFRTANSPAALSKLTSTPAILHGFRRHRVIGVDYPAILHCEASTVRGTLVQGLNDGDIWRLDVFEGTEYHREKATVRQILPAKEGENGAELIPMGEEAETRLGEEVECWVYVWIASREGLQEEEWDFEEFVREKMWRWVGDRAEAEGEYEEVDAVQAEGDPTRGRGPNGHVDRSFEEAEDGAK